MCAPVWQRLGGAGLDTGLGSRGGGSEGGKTRRLVKGGELLESGGGEAGGRVTSGCQEVTLESAAAEGNLRQVRWCDTDPVVGSGAPLA